MTQASSSSSPLYPVNGFGPASLQGATVVIPAVSLGNVPQLAADLLVSSLKLKRVAFLGRGDTVAPFSGKGDDGELVTGGLELYGQGEAFVLLQRAPTLKAMKDQHVELISSLVHQYGAGLALVLTSLDAANQDDTQLLTPYQAILPPKAGSHAALERLAQLPPLKLNIEAPNAVEAAIGKESQSSTKPYPPFLPGAGLTRRMLGALADVPSGAIAAWVVEGDNRGDARTLADLSLKVLGINARLVEPASWTGLFGRGDGLGAAIDAEIYG